MIKINKKNPKNLLTNNLLRAIIKVQKRKGNETNEIQSILQG